MNGREHVILAVVPASLILVTLQTTGAVHLSNMELATGIAITAIASLMPDIDHASSTISHTSLWMVISGLILFFSPLGHILESFSPVGFTWLYQWMLPSWSVQQKLGILIVLLSLVMVINTHLLSHRGPAHSLLCWFIETVCVFVAYQSSGALYPVMYTLCFSFGVLSHLVADCFTAGDLPDLFWPFEIDIAEACENFIDKISYLLDEIWFHIKWL